MSPLRWRRLGQAVVGWRGGGNTFREHAGERLHMVSVGMSVRLPSVGVNKALDIEEWNSA